MAKLVENKKRFLVIKSTLSEFSQIGSPCICDQCGEPMTGDIYYVAVLNRAMCKECYHDWYSRATSYPEDVPTEISNYNYYAELLGLPTIGRRL